MDDAWSRRRPSQPTLLTQESFLQSPMETPRENRKQLLNVFLSGGVPTQPQSTPLEPRSGGWGETGWKRPSFSDKKEDSVPSTAFKTKEKWSIDRHTPKGRAPPRHSLLEEESETNSGSASKDFSFRSVSSPQLRTPLETNESVSSPRSTSCWVTVFGFGPSLQTAVLREFRNYGEIVKYIPGKGNWMHICYATPLQAQIALGKRIHMVGSTTMVGAVPCVEQDIVREESSLSPGDTGNVSNSRHMQPLGSSIGYQNVLAKNQLYTDAPRPATGFLETLRNIFTYWNQ
ncbi:hypothetical protein GAYE_SCF05G2600 [Galdieria yellowstonensis]|uniref:RRM Nup35-type domain-containing protein n=1 Tax=Galdieria yellowstonensis TaxID=3028027 RepID=A0AAV9IBD0_9RHOD|nr:hypothetical protein GAYE_SCF05G2600 [Galdieria yellowstonensis]